jgi:hypothetical protein
VAALVRQAHGVAVLIGEREERGGRAFGNHGVKVA